MNLTRLRDSEFLLQGVREFFEWWAPLPYDLPGDDFDEDTERLIDRCPAVIREFGAILDVSPYFDRVSLYSNNLGKLSSS